MGSAALRSVLSVSALVALAAGASLAPAARAQGTFQAVDVNQAAFVVVSAPVGTSGAKAQLQIYEQVNPNKRPCFQLSGSNPVRVTPLLGGFDFTGICSRYVDSLGYSARIGSEDLGSGYRLTVRKTGSDNMLVAAPAGGAAGKPELLVARTYGTGGPVEYLELKLEPGWRLMRRAFGGKRLGHVYLYRDSWPAGGAAIPAAAAPAAAPAPVVARPVTPAPAPAAPPKLAVAKPVAPVLATTLPQRSGSKTPMASAAMALYAPSVTISCAPVAGVPTTAGRGFGRTIPLMTWYPSSFDRAGWTPQKRCQTVSQKLDGIRQKGELNYLTTGTVARQSVICAVEKPSSSCSKTNMIMTLEK
ncbi:MAG: DUF3747 domain-containing protein, partial [Cyanobacteria bacterium K_DeepCast_35m_m2_023]|nr:DUF3747 domain-containing protein [Cyanobacteria bacterium K_DeepCast_35m_m2_023]